MISIGLITHSHFNILKGILERDVLKVEKHLVDLNATLEHAMQPNKHNLRICFVVLSEMNGKWFLHLKRN